MVSLLFSERRGFRKEKGRACPLTLPRIKRLNGLRREIIKELKTVSSFSIGRKPNYVELFFWDSIGESFPFVDDQKSTMLKRVDLHRKKKAEPGIRLCLLERRLSNEKRLV